MPEHDASGETPPIRAIGGQPVPDILPEMDVLARSVFQHTQDTLEFRGSQRFRVDELQFPRSLPEFIHPILVARPHRGRPRQFDSAAFVSDDLSWWPHG